jgi:hypothetical protein
MPVTPDMRRSTDQIRVYLIVGDSTDTVSNADTRVLRRLDAGACAMHSELGQQRASTAG